MNRTGHIDWLSLHREYTTRFDLHTYVYAYWLADTEHSNAGDAGLSILKQRGDHPDWFVNAARAEQHLGAAVDQNVRMVSPSYYDVFDHNRLAVPLLAGVLLGTANFTLEGWFCGRDDLTRAGQQVMRKLDGLFLRPGVLVTFQQAPADESGGPRGSHDPATVQLPRGVTHR